MGKIAFVFPGQGAQSPGMGRELYEKYPSAREIYELCGQEVKDLSFDGTQELLNQTINAQPCLFAADLAAAKALESLGVTAEGAAGFSLGEIPALSFAGLLDVKEAYDFVCFRAKAMHESPEKGGMAAVMGLDAEAVTALCQSVDGVYPVNFNAPGQTVVAFKESVRDVFLQKAKEAKVKIIPLAVSGAFHSPLMAQASARIEEYLRQVKFNAARIPLYSNVHGRLYDSSPDVLLTKQVSSPVQWQSLIQQMIADGYNIFIETGPGKTLTGLIKRINKDVQTYNVFDAASLENTVAQLKGAEG